MLAQQAWWLIGSAGSARFAELLHLARLGLGSVNKILLGAATYYIKSSFKIIEIPDFHTYCYGRELNGVLGERFIFRVGVFTDRGMLPGLARTTALTTIAVQLRLN